MIRRSLGIGLAIGRPEAFPYSSGGAPDPGHDVGTACRLRRDQGYATPFRTGCQLQEALQVRQLLDLGIQHRRLDIEMLGAGNCRQEPERLSRPRFGRANDFALTDELRSEARSTAPLTGRAAQDQGIAAILDERLRFGASISTRHL